MHRLWHLRSRWVLGVAAVLLFVPPPGDGAAPLPSRPPSARPDILIVTVDTLRADRLGSYGYARKTSPQLDRLLKGGVRFSQARVVEPLTNPSICSMMTSLYPQDHGASRNGLRMRRGLASLPKSLSDHGYDTAAIVGNWTLKNKLSGLGEHFDDYESLLTRKRWFGFLRSEATAADLTAAAIEWLDDHRADGSNRPFMLWVHYVEPHAPYRFQEEFAEPLGLAVDSKKLPPSDRYDTEVAFVDHAIGRLIREVESQLDSPPLILFASDHGESLGEHDYWGHGRNLYEPGLRIPMGLTWRGRIPAGVVHAPALNIDLAPTILSLLDIPIPTSFRGYDWADALNGGSTPDDRVTHYQAHRGAVISKHESELARRKGLLAVGLIDGTLKEILVVGSGKREIWNLENDPGELTNLAETHSAASDDLAGWTQAVDTGLTSLDELPPEPLDDASAAQLRALGYVD
jgi:arylsulfatase A-like enzyme